MPDFKLYKAEKLCSRTAVNELFSTGFSKVAYPLRMVCKQTERNNGSPARFLITIPKKKIRKAVHRVLLRRRIRESYRLNRQLFVPQITLSGKYVDIAFLYLSSEIADYATIERKMCKLLEQLPSFLSDAAHEENAYEPIDTAG